MRVVVVENRNQAGCAPARMGVGEIVEVRKCRRRTHPPPPLKLPASLGVGVGVGGLSLLHAFSVSVKNFTRRLVLILYFIFLELCVYW